MRAVPLQPPTLNKTLIVPELPEVELITRSLRQLLKGRAITRAELLRPRLAPATSPREFAGVLRHRKFLDVVRRGKHILFLLDADLVLVTHLRMSGRFGYIDSGRELPRHTHALFNLDNDKLLVFSDQRHFGMMKLTWADQLEDQPELRKLGVEPFSPDFSPERFRKLLAVSRRSVKEMLLDQTKLVGVGNIYASEALFRARINPLAISARLSRTRSLRLWEAILQVLSESIQHGSTITVDPENIDGSYYGGSYVGRWLVYERENEPCAQCGRVIRRIVQNGRSTYYCPRCQRR
jgi:formamidopyrimidine-DNA glycosylase